MHAVRSILKKSLARAATRRLIKFALKCKIGGCYEALLGAVAVLSAAIGFAQPVLADLLVYSTGNPPAAFEIFPSEHICETSREGMINAAAAKADQALNAHNLSEASANLNAANLAPPCLTAGGWFFMSIQNSRRVL